MMAYFHESNSRVKFVAGGKAGSGQEFILYIGKRHCLNPNYLKNIKAFEIHESSEEPRKIFKWRILIPGYCLNELHGMRGLKTGKKGHIPNIKQKRVMQSEKRGKGNVWYVV